MRLQHALIEPAAAADSALSTRRTSARRPVVPARFDEQVEQQLRHKATGKRRREGLCQSGDQEGGKQEVCEQGEGGGEDDEEGGNTEEEGGGKESSSEESGGEESGGEESGGADAPPELVDREGAIDRVSAQLRDLLERRDGGLTWADDAMIDRLLSKRAPSLEEQQEQLEILKAWCMYGSRHSGRRALMCECVLRTM